MGTISFSQDWKEYERDEVWRSFITWPFWVEKVQFGGRPLHESVMIFESLFTRQLIITRVGATCAGSLTTRVAVSATRRNGRVLWDGKVSAMNYLNIVHLLHSLYTLWHSYINWYQSTARVYCWVFTNSSKTTPPPPINTLRSVGRSGLISSESFRRIVDRWTDPSFNQYPHGSVSRSTVAQTVCGSRTTLCSLWSSERIFLLKCIYFRLIYCPIQ